jgi:diadenosine tetraphosphate (Ap4A) HIT family hydrolase
VAVTNAVHRPLQPETIVEVGATWTIAVNVNQNLLGKTMLILNRRSDSVTDLTQEEWTDLHTQVRRLRVALDALFEPDQYNYAFLMNLDPQVHLHVVPRYRGIRRWGGLEFDDPHWGEVFGPEQRILEATHLGRMRDEIRATLLQD